MAAKTPREIERKTQQTTTLDEVARKAGVSISTVSRVMGGKPGISSSVRDHVTLVAKELSYSQRPRKPARNRVSSSRWAFIASRYILEHIRNGNPLYCVFFAALQEFLAAEDMNLLMIPVEDATPEASILQRLNRDKIQGGFCTHLPEPLLKAISSKFPVALYNAVSHDCRLDTIVADTTHAAYAQLMHLKTLGHRRIACFRVYPARPHHADAEYWKSLMEIAENEGIVCQPFINSALKFGQNEHTQAAEAYVEACFSSPTPPTAIVTHDFYAPFLMDSLQKRGLSVPEDVSLFGYSDNISTLRPNFRLSSYRPDYCEMARQAMTLLADRVARPTCNPRTVLVAGELVLRDSTAPAKG